MSEIKKILVIGATGMLAKPVMVELLNAGFSLSGMVRNLPQAQANLPSEIQLLKADLQPPQELEKAMQGQDALYLNLSVKQTERRQDFHSESEGLKNVISIARSLKIKRIAYISSLVMNYQGMNGFDWWVFRLKHQAVDLIKKSGIPYTIFYPSAFMETLPNLYKQGNRLVLAGKSEHKMYFIAGSDYGKQVAQSFQILSNENREYPIQGLDGYTADEACKIFQKHYPQAKLSLMRAPLGIFKFLGNFVTQLNYAYHILEALNKYPEKFISESTWEELGKPSINLEDYSKNLT
jgi:putative NADH-flavin reductase